MSFKIKTDEQVRLDRLESIVVELCNLATNSEYSWQQWADPLQAFIKEIELERKEASE